MSKWYQWPLNAVVTLLVLIGVAASATFYLREPYNPGFLKFPGIVGVHVVLGGFYLALAPFQFMRGIRRRWLGFHRWSGRALIFSAVLTGLSGLFMALVIPYSGWWERVIIGSFGVFFLISAVQGYLHVRARRIEEHRVWMARNFGLGLAVATQRLILIPLFILLDATPEDAALLNVPAFGAAIVLNALVTEVIIRLRMRPQTRLPRPRLTEVPQAE